MHGIHDAQELIKILSLPGDFSDKLNPFVRDKFKDGYMRPPETLRHAMANKFLTVDAENLQEMIAALQRAAAALQAMLADGVTLDPPAEPGTITYLVTADPEVAKKYDMHDESEFWDDADNESGDESQS